MGRGGGRWLLPDTQLLAEKIKGCLRVRVYYLLAGVTKEAGMDEGQRRWMVWGRAVAGTRWLLPDTPCLAGKIFPYMTYDIPHSLLAGVRRDPP